MEIIVIPINHINSHWTVVSVHLEEKKMVYYDSLSNNDDGKYIVKTLTHLFNDFLNLKEKWKYELAKTQKQSNSTDCGIFLCKFMDYIVRKEPIKFHVDDMSYFKMLIGIEFIQGEVLTSIKQTNSIDRK
jgi:sentrin-specific protease 1